MARNAKPKIVVDAQKSAEEPATAPCTNAAATDATPTAPTAATAIAPPTFRPGTKQALVVDLLRCGGGASLDEMVAATGWLPHTTRAALTGLRKRGIVVTHTKFDGVTRYSAGKA